MLKSLSNGVEISVVTRYLPQQSDAFNYFYLFQYTITIENQNDFTVQLLYRFWSITDSNGEKRNVEGEGVVGETPCLLPGEKFTYNSGCDFHTEMGQMKGRYRMQRISDGKEFYAEIPLFRMVAPFKLN
jgi:ApaG protein